MLTIVSTSWMMTTRTTRLRGDLHSTRCAAVSWRRCEFRVASKADSGTAMSIDSRACSLTKPTPDAYSSSMLVTVCDIVFSRVGSMARGQLMAGVDPCLGAVLGRTTRQRRRASVHPSHLSEPATDAAAFSPLITRIPDSPYARCTNIVLLRYLLSPYIPLSPLQLYQPIY